MKLISYIFCIAILELNTVFFISADEAFKMPDIKRKYHETTWVVSHNAPFSSEDDYVYYNQKFGLYKQYKAGSRGFELDIEKRCWQSPPIIGGTKCNISLCHDSCEVNKFLQPRIKGIATATGDPNSFKDYALKTIKKILTDNPNEILTITLENRVQDFQLLDKEFEDAGLANMILKPSDWDISANKGWPTLEWMIQNNKRLVIFSDRMPADLSKKGPTVAASKYVFFQWSTMLQNQWGDAKDINIARKERGQSEKENMGLVRYLYEFDWFPPEGKSVAGVTDIINKVGGVFKGKTPFAGDMNKINGPDLDAGLKKIVEVGLTSGRAKGRYPNFIKLDFIGEGTANAIANRINEMANDPAKRTQMYAPIP